MKKNRSIISDIIDNPAKYDYRLSEMMLRLMADNLDKQIESDIVKYFPTSQNESDQDTETEKYKSSFATKRYVDQFLNKPDNEKDEKLTERNRLEEMINYGKEE